MIIAAYAGCGKTTLAEKYSDICIDVTSMPYARILPVKKEETNRNFEAEKAAEYHVDNPIYPYNMIAEIPELVSNINMSLFQLCKEQLIFYRKNMGEALFYVIRRMA